MQIEGGEKHHTPGGPAAKPAAVLLAELGRGAAWLLALMAGVAWLDATFATRPLVGLGAGALAADLVAQRVGVPWAPPSDGSSRGWRNIATGASLGATLAATVVLAAAALGLARVEWGTPGGISLALGTVRSAAEALRSELLFRGIPLTLASTVTTFPTAAAFVALVGASPLMLDPTAGPEAWLVAAAAAIFFAVLWRLGRGATLAVGAHAGWLLAMNVAARGSVVQVTWTRGAAANASASGFGSGPPWLLAVVFGLAGFAGVGMLRRRA